MFDYFVATMKSLFAPAEEGGLVRGVGRPQPRAHALRPVLRDLLRARVGPADQSQISSKQAQRVAKLNLKNIILRTLGIKADPATYFTKYMYPRSGISVLYEGMAARGAAGGQRVLLESPVVRLERDGDRQSRGSSIARTAGEQTIECDVRAVDAAAAGAGRA